MNFSSVRQNAFAPLLGLVLCAGVLHADPMVTGSIGFDALAATNTGKLSTATEILSITQGVVAGGTQMGSYSSVPANTGPVDFSSIDSFHTIVGPLASSPLWTFSYDGNTYSFTATSISLVYQSANFLDISGQGYADITGYAQTAGDWSIDLTSATGNSSVKFVFGADSYIPSVPDSATTAGLISLGLGSLGVAMLARKRTVHQA